MRVHCISHAYSQLCHLRRPQRGISVASSEASSVASSEAAGKAAAASAEEEPAEKAPPQGGEKPAVRACPEHTMQTRLANPNSQFMLCATVASGGQCRHGNACHFAHSQEEIDAWQVRHFFRHRGHWTVWLTPNPPFAGGANEDHGRAKGPASRYSRRPLGIYVLDYRLASLG